MSKRYFLGLDVGSSSVKASLVDTESGKCAATTFYPETEAPIIAIKADGQSKIRKCGGPTASYVSTR